MPVIVFLIDTSASMNQRSYLGTTYLDVAKGAVETFLKLRSRDSTSRGDRYMLVTFEDPPAAIKAGWKETHNTFMEKLRNLQAAGLTTAGPALRTVFDLLNLNRLVSGIDNYGQGRIPFFLEPAIVVAITDGNKLASTGGVQDELHLPLTTPLPGSELTKEPFRWDQRLFSLVLRIPGHAPLGPEALGSVPSDDSPITAMCEVTGGRSYSVFSHRMLNQCLESLVQKIQSGVVIHFEKTGPDPLPTEGEGRGDGTSKLGPQPWHCCRRLIYVRPNPKTGVPVGHWPIPESFWPDQNSPTLPSRIAHPQILFSCVDSEPVVVDKVPFDKYELEPSPLTQYILERKSPHICWQVFVRNSSKYGDLGLPFGYLKASTALSCVNLFVMPYNYPVLLPLLDDLSKVHKLKPSLQWRQSFESYLKTMPLYYSGPLRKALRMIGALNLLPDHQEYGLSYSVGSYLKKLSQQTKVEVDRVNSAVGQKTHLEVHIRLRHRWRTSSTCSWNHISQRMQSFMGRATLPSELTTDEFSNFQLSTNNKSVILQMMSNPYDVPRRHLLDQLSRMRRNLLHGTACVLDQDQIHSVPIAQMGNYQDFLKHSTALLREVDSDQPKRLHTFGNPFKLDKKGMMIDEADEFVSGPQKGKRAADHNLPPGGGPKRRRCMSPLLHGQFKITTNHLSIAQEGNHAEAPHVTVYSTLNEPSTGSEHLEEYVAVQQHQLGAEVYDESEDERSEDELCLAIEEPVVPLRFPSPTRLKKQRNRENQEINNELQVLITREIRKPGRCEMPHTHTHTHTHTVYFFGLNAIFSKRVLIEKLELFMEEIHTRATSISHLEAV
uniref:VWFA domain-containing protein n=1 Tax=Denticeps clupeoides TaxID=299321 RepID=A0AAY4BA07_9TELE